MGAIVELMTKNLASQSLFRALTPKLSSRNLWHCCRAVSILPGIQSRAVGLVSRAGSGVHL